MNLYKDRTFSPVEEYAIEHIVQNKLTTIMKFGAMWRLYIDGEFKGEETNANFWKLKTILIVYPNRKDKGKYSGTHS